MRLVVVGLFMCSTFGLHAGSEPLFLSQLPLLSAGTDTIELPVAEPAPANQMTMVEWGSQISTEQDKATRMVDPGFESTSEIMRETEAKQEAWDRLFQVFFTE